jgi:methyl-accepting chemotaxis protein
VRELAQRSASAAKDIKQLIDASSDQVKFGVSLVDKTGQSLGDIIKKIQGIDTNIQAIAVSVKEQSVGLREINESVTVIDQGTQQNAAMVEQTTATSHGLAREAEALFELLSHFQLGSAAANSSKPPSPRNVETTSPTQRKTASAQHELKAQVASSFGSASVAQKIESWTEF